MYNPILHLRLLAALLLMTVALQAQTVSGRLTAAFRAFEQDAQLRNALASLYVVDAETGAVVFQKNASVGLAPASTQKVITSATAYALLGAGYRYTTELGYVGALEGTDLRGSLYLRGSGDPTLGSWRWKRTSMDSVLHRMLAAIRSTGLRQYASILVETTGWEGEVVPDGWIWQDVGNYYGAGAEGLNWHENQYDLVLRSGNAVGSAVTVVQARPAPAGFSFRSQATAGARGSGDNAYIYLPVGGTQINVRGTIPAGEERFVISGALPSGRQQLVATLSDSLSASGIQMSRGSLPQGATFTLLHREQSPPLDSIVFWFNRRSINLYGEALLRTLAFDKTKKASAEEGVDVVQDFWKDKGVAKSELNMVDGSGLSPLNRVTTHAQVNILRYARRQPWFRGFYLSLPEYNGMKMKSGTISGVKGFTGYHTARNGKEYIFSFLVNNYNGPSSSLVQKMYKVLDVLK